MSRAKLLTLALAGALTLGACATATPYQPAPRGAASVDGGYREQQIEPRRWRVSFAGNTLTSRETVETYLLYRAAELTVQNGFDWFTAVNRSTDAHSETWVISQPSADPWGRSWGPSWRYRHNLPVWRRWDPMGRDPFFDVQTVTRYEAVAEIVMGSGTRPADDPRAFDARAVLAMLGSRIVRPQ